jgi:dTDP-4-amino-4,6-dideoxygalactose transaminase
LQNHLKQQSVATGLHYPIPIHLQKPFRGLGYQEGDFPVTEELAANCLSLPVYPELSKRQIEQVVGAIRSAGR